MCTVLLPPGDNQIAVKKYTVTLGTNVSFSFTFRRNNCWNVDKFGLQKICTEHWAVCDNSNSNTSFRKDVNNETLTLNPEPREDFWIEVVKNISTICYYCLQGVLFVSNLIIPLWFEVLPTIEISVIFHNISRAIETPNQSPLKLSIKMYLIATR
jgi:hypothetical protein